MVSTTLLALGLADKVGEQDNKLKILTRHFAKLRGNKLPRINIQVLVPKPKGDATKWDYWEREAVKKTLWCLSVKPVKCAVVSDL